MSNCLNNILVRIIKKLIILKKHVCRHFVSHQCIACKHNHVHCVLDLTTVHMLSCCVSE